MTEVKTIEMELSGFTKLVTSIEGSNHKNVIYDKDQGKLLYWGSLTQSPQVQYVCPCTDTDLPELPFDPIHGKMTDVPTC